MADAEFKAGTAAFSFRCSSRRNITCQNAFDSPHTDTGIEPHLLYCHVVTVQPYNPVLGEMFTCEACSRYISAHAMGHKLII